MVSTVTGPALDFNPHHLNAGLKDGDFGTQTLKAVKAFQKQHKTEGVLVDGIVGDQTWSFLREGVPTHRLADSISTR